MQSQSLDKYGPFEHGLAQQIAVHLQGRLGNHVCDLRVMHRDNELILQGRATTYYAKQITQHVAMEVSGLSIAANEIEVLLTTR